MTTSNHTTPAAEPFQPSVDLQDASSWAGNIIHTAIMMHAGELMSGPALALWESIPDLGERYGHETHLGYLKALDALISSPDAMQQVLRRTRSALVTADARLAASSMPAAEAESKRTQEELDRAQLVKDADELICVYTNNSEGHTLAPVAEALYSASSHCIQADNATEQRVGYILALGAFLASPGALDAAARTLRQKLVASDPNLALLRK